MVCKFPEHYPFLGPRPMRFPYTVAAQIAQFPFVYHWRYVTIFKYFIFSMGTTFLLGAYVSHKANAEDRLRAVHAYRKQIYTRHVDPDDHLF